MAVYNTSLAHDLSDFEVDVKKELSPQDLKLLKNRKPQKSRSINIGVVCAFAIVVALVCLMVYNHVQLNELSMQMNDLTTEMEILESKNVTMTSALESTISLTKVAELAEKMGMQKRDEYQTQRIYLYQDDKIERTEAAPQSTGSETAKLAVTSLFSRFKEYMNAR